ncbi:hypothetical protein SHL15_0886 [Streptomyces hygroscopicus subsp. limoneus]|nr:hypothetical protein SHL15_0886 [Streptomyces hygroscopicus subsp. limoneus]
MPAVSRHPEEHAADVTAATATAAPPPPGRAGDAVTPAPRKESQTVRPAPPPRQADTAPAPERTPPPAPPGWGLTPQGLRRLQGAAGNAAVSRLVAQRYTAPVKPPPSQAPGMRRVTADIAAKKQKLAQHRPATAESRSAQDAAKAPPDDKEAQGKAANAEKMNAAKPGEFDKAAFIAAVNEAIAAQAPKNLDEADKFADSGKAEKVKGAVDGKVTDGKKASAKDIETTTKAAPDTSKAKEKQVVPLRPDQPPANPGAPSAEDATPRQQPPEVTDFSEGPRKTDQQMADADVTEEQLARSNEPDFTAALGEKRKAEQHSATAPAQARTAEKAQLATAKSGAAAAGAQAMNALTATRNAAGKQVDGGKGEAKSKDEQKRAEVTTKLQKVFDATQKDVEGILEGLDGKVDKQFEEGEKKARDAFTTDQKRRMKAYKDKRYGGFWGPAKWAKDKIAGMPEEANQLFQESRKLYVRMMQGVISSVADTIGAELGKAKARIAKGRAELKAEVDKLPADLKKYGEEAAKDFAGKFDDLESEVDDKSKQLVQTLAQKYTQALNAVDEEIKKLQEANKGLVQKAVDAVAGVIKTIKELKDLLMGILAKAAAAITKIIKDPIGFLGNLVRAVGAGLQQFVSNIGTHLQSGLVSWLLGTAVKAGIEIPSRFDLKGIIQLIASLLGLTWANIRARITLKGVPDQAMNTVEQSVPVAKALATEGPAGAVNEIQAEVGDLKSTILEELKSYLIPTVIIAGITWILSLLNPASAFVRAVKGIIDIVSFIVNQGAQIVQFVNAVLDAVVAIAGGGSAGVPKMVETALAASVPLLIGFLASLLGIGGLANKIRQVFQKVARPVNRIIDKIAAKIARLGKKLWSRLKTAVDRRKRDSEEDSGSGAANTRAGKDKTHADEDPNVKVRVIDRRTTIGAEVHTIRARVTRTRATILMASGGFESIGVKIRVLQKIARMEQGAADPARQKYGDELYQAVDDVGAEAHQLVVRYEGMPDTPARDRMLDSGLNDLSEMISNIGVRFMLPGLEFRRPTHNLVPSAVDRYGRATAYSGDPLSRASQNMGSPSRGVYIPGIDIDGVGTLERGHLVADLLGGPGGDPRNLSPMTKSANTAMKRPERAVADFIYKGDLSNQVTYEVRIEHNYADATAYQAWLASKFPQSAPDAGEKLFKHATTHRPSVGEINAAIGGRRLSSGQHELVLRALAHYLITSQVVFSITWKAGPMNTVPTPSATPISNQIPPP